MGERFRIATWNVNSVRKRLPLVQQFLRDADVDVLCLQEIKCTRADFPEKVLRAAGYPHIAINGQKSYNGVAILSRIPFLESCCVAFCQKNDARHISVSFGKEAGEMEGVTLHNFYVPAGGEEPDRDQNPKFAHKLNFLQEMQHFSEERLATGAVSKELLVGDLNVAPFETDVWSHERLLNVVSHTPIECKNFLAILEKGWVDVVRQSVGMEKKLYTWWSYRSPNWEQSDKGRRLDHIWASPDLALQVASVEVRKEMRGCDVPSDHVPVIASWNFGSM